QVGETFIAARSGVEIEMGFVDHNDRAFAFGVRRFFNPRFEIGVRDLLSADFSGAEGRGRQVEGDSENEFCHTHSLFREPGTPVIPAARASVCAIQEGAASADRSPRHSRCAFDFLTRRITRPYDSSLERNLTGLQPNRSGSLRRTT